MSSDRPHTFHWLAGAAFVALLIASSLVDRGGNDLVRTVGVGVLLLSPFLFVPPFFLLKKYGGAKDGEPFFDTTVTVDHGLYAIVRHPQYLGYMVLMLGFVLLSQHVLTVLFGLAGIVFFYLHTVQEDRFCRERLGEEYREYASDVPSFNIVVGVIRYLRRRQGSPRKMM
ncbi:MAG: isoprenylcysteine carboxylmethyltransferase family protein [Gemmatimonadota bacterium]|nr:MAG: isoprenylcysteine carboxylmethyltransferase family protein [Gemmatimonadota bacterium]